MNNYQKGFIKQPVKNKVQLLPVFLFSTVGVLFLFPYQSVCIFEKLIRFHEQAFIVYKNGENLKILIEIFCQEVIVSNFIFGFLDHLEPKTSFNSQPWLRPT